MLNLESLMLAAVEVPAGGNVIIEYFVKGGPIMWPILLVSVVSVGVVLERSVWWAGLSASMDNERLQRVYQAVRQKDPRVASSLARASKDPRLVMLWSGLNYTHDTMESALQSAARSEVKKAGRFLIILDTIITLAPLLGLLGTVTGIMGAFSAVSGEGGGLNVDAVSGGIGEALIATACGLGVAMFCLVPFNYFNSRVESLASELENTVTDLETIMKGKPMEFAHHEAELAPAAA